MEDQTKVSFDDSDGNQVNHIGKDFTIINGSVVFAGSYQNDDEDYKLAITKVSLDTLDVSEIIRVNEDCGQTDPFLLNTMSLVRFTSLYTIRL